jgi:hypothetical protein
MNDSDSPEYVEHQQKAASAPKQLLPSFMTPNGSFKERLINSRLKELTKVKEELKIVKEELKIVKEELKIVKEDNIRLAKENFTLIDLLPGSGGYRKRKQFIVQRSTRRKKLVK